MEDQDLEIKYEVEGLLFHRPILIYQSFVKLFGLKAGAFLSLALYRRQMDQHFSEAAVLGEEVLSEIDPIFKELCFSQNDRTLIIKILRKNKILELNKIDSVVYYSLNESEISKQVPEGI